MELLNVFLAAAKSNSASGTMGWGIIIFYVVLFGGMIYLMVYRPQKKQQAAMDSLQGSLAIGDSVVTSGGFYGVIIDMQDDIVIVEFGNNKNCRIPMKKAAIVQSEKPNGETISAEK